MGHGMGANCSACDPSARRAGHDADETRLGRLLARTYAERDARLLPSDDALAKLNAALDAIGTPSQRRADHRRLFVACALVAIFFLLLGPIAHTEYTVSTRNAPRAVTMPINHAGGISADPTIHGRPALAPVTIAASEGDNSTGQITAASGTAGTAGSSETPLRDLLARAGIHASDPAIGPPIEGQPPQH